MLHCKQKGRVTFRPTLEVLEGRLTPTTNFHWKGGHIGNPTDWDDGRNWVDDSGVAYSRSRYPGSVSDEDVAIFDSNATTNCDFSGTDGPIAEMSTDENFAFNVNLNGNLAVDGDLALRGATYYVNGTFTTDNQALLIFNVNLVVSSSCNTLVVNGDFAYTWNGDTSQHNSLVVDGPPDHRRRRDCPAGPERLLPQ